MLDFTTLQAVVFDMDGVLWRGDEPLPGIPQIFEFLQTQQIKYAFATNNSSRTREMYVEKLEKFGIPAEVEQIVTSSTATAHYLRKTFPDMKNVYAVGQIGLIEALKSHDFVLADADVNLVVAGYDFELTYEKLRQASHHIQDGALFIGTNPDKSFPEPGGYVAPGAGSILAAIETATGLAPQIIGKPEPPMFRTALDVLGTEPAQTLMVGDRLETDIQGGLTVGMQTALVLSGISQPDDIEKTGIQPQYMFNDVADLLAQWQAQLTK